jgi:hypothetical protein
LKVNPGPAAAALVIFILFIFLYDISLATSVSKAYLTLLCGAIFFASSLATRAGSRLASVGSEISALFATLLLAGLIFLSLPLPISLPSIVSGGEATIFNISEGQLDGPSAVIRLEMVNADVTIETWNGSVYRIVSDITAQGFTDKAARRLLEKCRLSVEDVDGNISILLTGSGRLQRRVKPRLWIQLPMDSVADLLVSVTEGSLNLTGLRTDTVQSRIRSGRIDARSLEARVCELTVENGPIDTEVVAAKIDLQTISGDIRLVSARPKTELSIESVNGRIDAYLNFSQEIAYEVEANTIGGSISVNLTGVVFTKQKSGFIFARTKDFDSKNLTTHVFARTTTGNVTVAQI